MQKGLDIIFDFKIEDFCAGISLNPESECFVGKNVEPFVVYTLCVYSEMIEILVQNGGKGQFPLSFYQNVKFSLEFQEFVNFSSKR